MPLVSSSSCAALVELYTLSGLLMEARQLIERMLQVDIASWNMLLAGYSQNSYCKRTFDGISSRNEVTWNSMAGAYVQNGQLSRAIEMLERMPQLALISWHILLGALVQNGRTRESIHLFHQMLLEAVISYAVALVSVLTTCSHAGLVSSSRLYFTSMLSDYERAPVAEQFSCVIDLLGRVGRLEDAEVLINVLPFAPSIVVWGALLGSSRRGRGGFGLDLEQVVSDPFPEVEQWMPTARVLSCITTCGNSTDSMGHYIATVLGPLAWFFKQVENAALSLASTDENRAVDSHAATERVFLSVFPRTSRRIYRTVARDSAFANMLKAALMHGS
ncbi:pentatricopeptide repeat-containing protein At3g29230-like [Selaginella moellendorffii]|uniref:pentatricopeptide repeat-containing protein At3g29230-like n=1 Tax=Selaginella moellendorffii TaxID=88036 RepID=UPI000D1CA57A|nr:pentatricopeptide repeat-containing protein At3g29230-like [Selaginella moellendorffii]|eukprot:XP_024538149.1 pentatricopeptide repeat-containing protein At3g29230-like [Selaginella moellendorffii]